MTKSTINESSPAESFSVTLKKLFHSSKFISLPNMGRAPSPPAEELMCTLAPSTGVHTKETLKIYGLQADREADNTEELDEDMIVTQSQTNFICPITLLEMKKPVKNKVCGHTYDEEAVVRMIESRHRRKKKACCPKVGCSHTDMRISDLIQDEALRRAIENHNKKRRRQST
ncbi:hypothetical protein FD754_003036 [Muntiacus muntjak]|uniref:E3 SUMO-protein ligase NSE2 n=1 Tax=Muntiacus muntjak TaxID=9888 RepID=A0A5N3WB05_MUNMU|nr:hypothetical protein FD754_003036 [Muntiacus muntjak]